MTQMLRIPSDLRMHPARRVADESQADVRADETERQKHTKDS